MLDCWIIGLLEPAPGRRQLRDSVDFVLHFILCFFVFGPVARGTGLKTGRESEMAAMRAAEAAGTVLLNPFKTGLKWSLK